MTNDQPEELCGNCAGPMVVVDRIGGEEVLACKADCSQPYPAIPSQVTIWHNADGNLFEFTPRHRVTPVFTYVSAGLQEDLLREAWEITNSYPEEMHTGVNNLPVVRAYRAQRLRSLCMGDLVQLTRHHIGEALYVVIGNGFSRLAIRPTELNIAPNPHDNFVGDEED